MFAHQSSTLVGHSAQKLWSYSRSQSVGSDLKGEYQLRAKPAADFNK